MCILRVYELPSHFVVLFFNVWNFWFALLKYFITPVYSYWNDFIITHSVFAATDMPVPWLLAGLGRSIVTEGDVGETSEPGKKNNTSHMGHSLQHLFFSQRHADPHFNNSRPSAPQLTFIENSYICKDTQGDTVSALRGNFLRCKCGCFVICGSPARQNKTVQ